MHARATATPSPRRGEGWGEGVRVYRESGAPSPRPSPQPKSDVSDFGHLNMAQLGNTRVGQGEGEGSFISRFAAIVAVSAALSPALAQEGLRPYVVVGNAIPGSLTGASGDAARGRAIVGNRQT